MDAPLSKEEAQLKFKSFIHDNRKKLRELERFRKDYEDVSQVLETLPHKIRHKIMVPISNVAFMEGYLDRTNEVYALIGDDYFIKCSTQHAKEIIGRRLNFVNRNIDIVTKDFENIKSKLGLATEVLDVRKTEDGFFEIIEQLEEEDEIKLFKDTGKKPIIEVLSSNDEESETNSTFDNINKETSEEKKIDIVDVPPLVKKVENLSFSHHDNDSDKLVVDMGMTFGSNKTEKKHESKERVSRFKEMMMKKKG